MVDEKVIINVLTLHNAATTWHIIAFMFFISVPILTGLFYYVTALGFLIVGILCEISAFLRQKRIKKYLENES